MPKTNASLMHLEARTILLPDSIQKTTLKSVRWAEKQVSQEHAQQLLVRLNKADSQVVSVDRAQLLNPVLELIRALALPGLLDIYVGVPPLRIDPIALLNEPAGFSFVHTLNTGRLTLMPNLRPHGCLDTQRAGDDIFVCGTQFHRVCHLRRTPEATVRSILESAYQIARTEGRRFVKAEAELVIERAEPPVIGWSQDEIWKAAKDIVPEKERGPGAPKGPRAKPHTSRLRT